MNFNDDKKGLIAEENKILDKLIEEMNDDLSRLDEDLQKYVEEARAVRSDDEYLQILEAKDKIKKLKKTKAEIFNAKDELYNARVIVKVGNTPMELKIGLHSHGVGAKCFIFKWTDKACRQLQLNNELSEYDVEVEDKFGKYHTHYTVLFREKVAIRFTKVKDAANIYPIKIDEEIIKGLMGTGALSDGYLMRLAEKVTLAVDKMQNDEIESRVIYDEFLQELVQRRSDSEFQNIVFSIQKKQGEIIQAPFEQNLIVQGCAGSGKSMIMLHRLPILLCDNPDNIDKTNIYIISPSQAYIQLADNMRRQLEIEDLKMGTFNQYYDYCIEKYRVKPGDAYGRITTEKVLNKSHEDYVYSEQCIDDIVSFFEKKAGENYISLDEAYEILDVEAGSDKAVTFDGKFKTMLLEEQKLLNENKKIIESYFRRIKATVGAVKSLGSALGNRKKRVLDEIKKRISGCRNNIAVIQRNLSRLKSTPDSVAYKNRLNEIKAENDKIAELENLKNAVESDDEYFSVLLDLKCKIDEALRPYLSIDSEFIKNKVEDIYEYISRARSITALCYSLQRRISKLDDKYNMYCPPFSRAVNEVMESLYALRGNNQRYLPCDYCLRLISHRDYLDELIRDAVKCAYEYIMGKLGIIPDKNGKIDAVECSPYLYLQILYQYSGAPNERKETLITIDEAQNVSPQELKLIQAVNGESVKLNLFGDERQHIEGAKGIDSWTEFDDVFSYRRYDMQENYRNASQITEYCNKCFDMDMRAINTSGKGVHEINNLDELKSRLTEQFLNVKVAGLAAVIVKNSLEARWFIDQFPDYSDKLHNLADGESDINRTDWNIITVSDAKGIEFSTVIALSGNMSHNEKYITYTRAMDELFVYDKQIDVSQYEILSPVNDEADRPKEKTEKTTTDTVTKDNSYEHSSDKQQTMPKFKTSKVREYFESIGLKTIDTRENGGKLWVIGERTDIEEYVKVASERFGVIGKYSSDRSLGIMSGWCTKTKK